MKCKAKTKTGSKCKNKAMENSNFCKLHSHSNATNAHEEPSLLFIDALYYPSIEIPSEEWLKTAALYWDTLSTIVPSSMKPYKEGTAKALSEAGVLRPTYVDPDMPELDRIADDVLDYIHTDEGQRALFGPIESGTTRIHNKKMSKRLLRELGNFYYIHNDKMADKLAYKIRRSIRQELRDSWIGVPSAFGSYYMTVLASNLASKRGRVLLTDKPTIEGLASRVQLGCGLLKPSERRIPTRIAEGLLATLALKTVNISPKTSAKKLLSFREKYDVERSRFRSAIRNLVSSLSGNVSPELLAGHVKTLFKDEVRPSIDQLKGRLRDHRITCGFSNLKLSSLASTSPTVIGGVLSQVGLGPLALFAGIGLSIVLQTGNYRVQKREILRGNPYSYVLSAEKTFGKSRRSK